MTLHGVGLDVVDLTRMRRLLQYGEVFTRRWFTDVERGQCERATSLAEAYAVRFAIKEAVWKSLRVPRRHPWPVPWQGIAAVSEPEGDRWRVVLSAIAARAAQETGVVAVLAGGRRQGEIAVACAYSYGAGDDGARWVGVGAGLDAAVDAALDAAAGAALGQ